MTAINVLRQRAAVHILSDGAAYGQDGELVSVLPKVFPLPHLNAAVAFRGTFSAMAMLAEMLAQAESYDHLKLTIVDELRAAITVIKGMTQQSTYGDETQVYVAGFSEATGADAYTVLTHPSGGAPAWTVIPIEDLSMAPCDDGKMRNEVWQIVGGRRAEEIDAKSDGLKLMEVQRRHKMRLLNGTEMFGVGGFAQLTTIRSDVISTKILRAWPDVIGKKIRPN